MTDNWDDWFKYNTLYQLVVFDGEKSRHDIGGVKIGQFKMQKEQRRPALPAEFDELGEEFFSLGQDDSYYEDLNKFGDEARDFILRGLRDMAFDIDRFQRAREESVTGVSLLRSVTPATVQGQFSRISRGGARLSKYHFSYTAPKPRRTAVAPPVFSFDVEPGSNPPTNVHVIIGRNGVGKTHLLNNMTRAIVDSNARAGDVGSFAGDPEDFLDDQVFANIVSVSFSAFDSFEPLPNRQNKSEGGPPLVMIQARTGRNEGPTSQSGNWNAVNCTLSDPTVEGSGRIGHFMATADDNHGRLFCGRNLLPFLLQGTVRSQLQSTR
nr:hypothetical protein [Brucella intermedia]